MYKTVEKTAEQIIEKIKENKEMIFYLNTEKDEDTEKIIKEKILGISIFNKALDEQRREGKKVGDRQRQIKTAKRLIKEKMKPEFISKITDLSIEEIEKLK